ncbi:short-chain dehydrogenase protein [Coleophoma cylindrospora]|uniref:Short-chain dehydrogenase protein n=1 Tax=Coleophoma cylindrospora TaxID=1849047 RepID=A0A3D8QH40_9HELO|nr:short-chain dehydrogenase protein [Coleophoma cylindrospora]
MPYALKGRNVLVTGGSRGLGELICLKFASEGCNVAINYVSSADRAKGIAEKIEKDYGVKAVIIQGDMGKEADCARTVQESIAELGGLDILISNAGYTRFSQFADISAPTTEDWDMCFAVNVKAQTHLMKSAQATFNANPEGGVMIITSSIAGEYVGGSSMPYSVTKAAQLHLMRCLASTQAPKIRVNAVLPGLLLTEWGLKYGEKAIQDLKDRAWLKKEAHRPGGLCSGLCGHRAEHVNDRTEDPD